MATFMEEFRKRFRFFGYGEAGAKFSMSVEDGGVVRMLPVHVLGKSFNFRVETEEAFAALPSEGTMLLLRGVLKRRKNSVEGLTGELQELITSGKPGWKAPTDTDFLSGLLFEGCGVVSRKMGGVYQGGEFRNIQVASLGCTLVFKRLEPSLFDQISEDAKAYFFGSLEPKVVSVGTFVTDELVPSVELYRVFTEEKAKEKPSVPAA